MEGKEENPYQTANKPRPDGKWIPSHKRSLSVFGVIAKYTHYQIAKYHCQFLRSRFQARMNGDSWRQEWHLAIKL